MFCSIIIFLLFFIPSIFYLFDYIREKRNGNANPSYYLKSTHIHQHSNSDNNKMPIQTNLVGVTFGNRLQTIRNLTIGDLVSIIPERDNTFDKNALAVYTNDQKIIGYINKTLAEKLANKFVFTDKDYYTVTANIINFTSHLGATTGVIIEFVPPDSETKMKKAKDYFQKLKMECHQGGGESTMGDKIHQNESGRVDMEEVLIFFQQTVKSLVASSLPQEQAITKSMEMVAQKFGPESAQQLIMAAQQALQGK